MCLSRPHHTRLAPTCVWRCRHVDAVVDWARQRKQHMESSPLSPSENMLIQLLETGPLQPPVHCDRTTGQWTAPSISKTREEQAARQVRFSATRVALRSSRDHDPRWGYCPAVSARNATQGSGARRGPASNQPFRRGPPRERRDSQGCRIHLYFDVAAGPLEIA